MPGVRSGRFKKQQSGVNNVRSSYQHFSAINMFPALMHGHGRQEANKASLRTTAGSLGRVPPEKQGDTCCPCAISPCDLLSSSQRPGQGAKVCALLP